MISFKHSGDFSLTEKFFNKAKGFRARAILERYAKEGVEALSAATPVDTGETANSWDYEIKKLRSGYTISWTNSSINNGVPIVILIQYGHATGNGGYVQGNDFINPAIQPIIDKLAEELWKESGGL